jgi:hypothetical protein
LAVFSWPFLGQREAKMKKLITFIMVLGLAAGVRAERGLSQTENPDTENFLMAKEPVTVIGPLCGDCSVYIVYVEKAEDALQAALTTGDMLYLSRIDTALKPDRDSYTARNSIIRLLPHPATIALLGLAGFMFGCRRNVRGLLLRI